MKKEYQKLRSYLLLWSTQSLSGLGSAMTNFALVIWLYQKSGSALETALLSICSYAPLADGRQNGDGIRPSG